MKSPFHYLDVSQSFSIKYYFYRWQRQLMGSYFNLKGRRFQSPRCPFQKHERLWANENSVTSVGIKNEKKSRQVTSWFHSIPFRMFGHSESGLWMDVTKTLANPAAGKEIKSISTISKGSILRSPLAQQLP